jgi:apolipoprotein N-acyltransferase
MPGKKLSAVSLLKPDWLTILSAALIVPAFPPWNHGGLIWIALVPWFAALSRTRTNGQAWMQGLWLSILMSLGGFYWVAHVLQEFGSLPWPVAAAGLALFSLVGQPQFTLFAPVWRKLRLERSTDSPAQAESNPPSQRWPFITAVVLAAAYTGLDWGLPKLFVDTLGHSQYQQRILRQAADLGGATLLTFAIFVVNESIFVMLWRVRSRREPSLWPAMKASLGPFALAGTLVLGGWLYGEWRLPQIERLEASPVSKVQVGVIQANIGDFDKIAAEKGISGAADKVVETFFGLSDRALAMNPKPQLVVWPETSYPSTFRTPTTADEMARDQKVEHYARTRKIPVLFGGYDHQGGKDFNSFFFLSPTPGNESSGGISGGDLKVYHKNVLLMFGEYIPGAEQFHFLKTAFPQVGNFGRGKGPEVVEVPFEGGSVRTGPIICYEALFPDFVIDAARQGSQMILNITNDSWFGPSGEPELHLSLTTFRSIETRLPQLRSTNTGISALILPNGDITSATPVGQALVMNVTVPLIAPEPTLMKRWGDWFGRSTLILGWMGVIALWLGLRRRTAAV